MRRNLLLLSVLGAVLLTGACSKPASELSALENTEQKQELPKLTVDEVNALLVTEDKPHLFDANTDSTRAKHGTIPGSTLLTGVDYDVAKTLPEAKDQKLVFYCSSTKCSAAERAAARAKTAGYSDVSVMPEGIKGWARAGKKVNQI